MNTQQLAKPMLIAAAISFFMLLTRGSHALTPFSLPDASIVLFLLGGLWLKRWGWFAALFVLAAVTDFGTAAFDPAYGFCLTNGYWGLIPSYGAMWLGGQYLAKQPNTFAPLPYAITSMTTALVAFVISTQTYYLFSGRFPNHGVLETMQYGWNYLPSWMAVNAGYAAAVWLLVALFRSIKTVQTASL